MARSSFITSDKQLHFNGEAIELWWHPSAHTNGDVLVYFPRSDVIVAGDLLQMGTFPMFDVEAGGRLQGMLNGLNQIIDLAVPRFNQIGGTRIVPGPRVAVHRVGRRRGCATWPRSCATACST